MIPVTDGYDRNCKSGDSARNPEAQRHILQKLEICGEYMLSDEMTSSSMPTESRSIANG